MVLVRVALRMKPAQSNERWFGTLSAGSYLFGLSVKGQATSRWTLRHILAVMETLAW